MSDLTVRRYRPDDGPRVRDLHEAAMRDVGAYVEGVSDEDLASITETYLDRGGEFLVGLVDERIVAMGALRPVEAGDYIAQFVGDDRESTVELTRMRVDPDHQRQGYGQRLYDELERRAREKGFEKIVLDTRATQTAARRFYERNGFETVRRERIEAFDEPFELLVSRKSIVEAR